MSAEQSQTRPKGLVKIYWQERESSGIYTILGWWLEVGLVHLKCETPGQKDRTLWTRIEYMDSIEDNPERINEADLLQHKDWSTRVWSGLAAEGIRTWGGLCSKSQSDLLQIRNMGKTSLNEIVRKLKERGMELRG